MYDTDSSKFFYWKGDESRWQILDDNSSINELIHSVTYDTSTHIIEVVDAGGTYRLDFSMLDNRKGYQKIYLSPTGGTLNLTNDGGSVLLPEDRTYHFLKTINYFLFDYLSLELIHRDPSKCNQCMHVFH
ncbi:MAG: hypothetical protein ACI9JN_000875 [Bacteroidia bacterium]